MHLINTKTEYECSFIHNPLNFPTSLWVTVRLIQKAPLRGCILKVSKENKASCFLKKDLEHISRRQE